VVKTKAIVTGAAGFIGSHLVDALVARGDRVVGIDCFTDYYHPRIKRANLGNVVRAPEFDLLELDLRSGALERVIDGADVIFHQAGQPGVRSSFGMSFDEYCGHNILATQRLLDAARTVGIKRLVFASSSSVYGNAPAYPTSEEDLPCPFSPYGVTKLAAEHLCRLYAANWGLPTVSLRYFSVYGPRQRPDMALHKLIHAAVAGEPFALYGDGSQIRDFTYVSDVVDANLAAAEAPGIAPGTILNISGGSNASMLEVIDLVRHLTGCALKVTVLAGQPGDVSRTGGSTYRATETLGWRPRVPFEAGLAAQIAAVTAEERSPAAQ
jgi:UDP-glucuronate 4-epimerase